MAIANPRRKKAAKKTDDPAERIRKSAYEKQFPKAGKEAGAAEESKETTGNSTSVGEGVQKEQMETSRGQKPRSDTSHSEAENPPMEGSEVNTQTEEEKTGQNKAPQRNEVLNEGNTSEGSTKVRQQAKKGKNKAKSEYKTLSVDRNVADAAFIAAKLTDIELRSFVKTALEKHIRSMVKKGILPELPQFEV